MYLFLRIASSRCSVLALSPSELFKNQQESESELFKNQQESESERDWELCIHIHSWHGARSSSTPRPRHI